MKLHELIDLKLLYNFPIIHIRRKRYLGHGNYSNSYSSQLSCGRIQELIPKGDFSLNTTNTKTKDHPNHLNQRTQRENLLTLVIPKLGQQETNGEKSIYTMLQP